MARLRVQELAKARGLTLSDLSREAKLTMNLARRYWYNTSDGKAEGPALKEVRLDALDKLAEILGCQPGDLISPDA